jgi:hypothetical protein
MIKGSIAEPLADACAVCCKSIGFDQSGFGARAGCVAIGSTQ